MAERLKISRNVKAALNNITCDDCGMDGCELHEIYKGPCSVKVLRRALRKQRETIADLTTQLADSKKRIDYAPQATVNAMPVAFSQTRIELEGVDPAMLFMLDIVGRRVRLVKDTAEPPPLTGLTDDEATVVRELFAVHTEGKEDIRACHLSGPMGSAQRKAFRGLERKGLLKWRYGARANRNRCKMWSLSTEGMRLARIDNAIADCKRASKFGQLIAQRRRLVDVLRRLHDAHGRLACADYEPVLAAARTEARSVLRDLDI